PGGRASDRFGARRAGLAALLVIAAFSAASAAAPAAWLAIVTRALTGIGTGAAFIAGGAGRLRRRRPRGRRVRARARAAGGASRRLARAVRHCRGDRRRRVRAPG